LQKPQFCCRYLIEKLDAFVQQMAQFQAMCATSMAALFTHLERLEHRYGIVLEPFISRPLCVSATNHPVAVIFGYQAIS